MTETFWDFSVSPWRIAVSVLMLCALGWLALRSVRRFRDSGRRYAAVEGLRILTAALVVITLFRPEYVRRIRNPEQPVVAVLADTSESMQTRDVLTADRAAARSRADWVTSALSEDGPLSSIESRYALKTWHFSSELLSATNTAPDLPVGTDINAALKTAAERHGNLRAILLLSDGDHTTGPSPISAATQLRLQGVPVFAVSAGAPRHLPDLELQSVQAPAYGLLDEHVFIPFTLLSHLDRDVNTTVFLRGSDGQVLQKKVFIPANSQVQDSVILRPRRRGTFDFTIEIPVEKEELHRDNNRRAFQMAFRREMLHVLVIDSLPRWEYRYLRNALSRDPGVSVNCLLFHPGLPPGDGPDYLPAFPESLDALSRYDVVFVGDVGIGAGELTAEQAERLAGLVQQQGSGLVFMPGIRGRQLQLEHSALWELMPVVPGNTETRPLDFSVESRLHLTTRGRDHLLTMLASDPAANWSLWKNLPGFYWHATVEKPKPGSNVLAVHETARSQHGRMPLLVSRAAGNGKTLFMGTDSAWRWRRGVEDTYHYRFWGQVVRWMAHQRHLANDEGIRFFYSPENPRQGKQVFLHATVFDQAGFPVDDGEVFVTLTHTDGFSRKLQLQPEGSGWGVFTGTFTPDRGGVFTATISCESAGRRLSTDIRVQSPRREHIGRPAKPALLKEIAAVTGGRFSSMDGFPEMVQHLRVLPETRPREERMLLWCHPLWLAGILTLLGLQWVFRKLLGML